MRRGEFPSVGGGKKGGALVQCRERGVVELSFSRKENRTKGGCRCAEKKLPALKLRALEYLKKRRLSDAAGKKKHVWGDSLKNPCTTLLETRPIPEG